MQCIYLIHLMVLTSHLIGNGQPLADVKDGKKEHISREPEMVKAFRDTWKDGMHSFLYDLFEG